MNNNFGRNKILVVDDEVQIVQMISRLLSRNFEIILPAHSGKEAKRLISEHDDIDVILCDVKMPEIDGFKVFEFARKKLPNTPFLFLSGHVDEQKLSAAMKKGVSDFLSKPIAKDALLGRIERAIEKRILTLDEKKIKKLDTI